MMDPLYYKSQAGQGAPGVQAYAFGTGRLIELRGVIGEPAVLKLRELVAEWQKQGVDFYAIDLQRTRLLSAEILARLTGELESIQRPGVAVVLIASPLLRGRSKYTDPKNCCLWVESIYEARDILRQRETIRQEFGGMQ